MTNLSSLEDVSLSPISLSPVDDYSSCNLSEGAETNLRRLLYSTSSGLVSLAPLICNGPNQCKFVSRCPIWMADGVRGDYPLGKQCIVEMNLAAQKFGEYAQELNITGEVIKNPSLRSQVSKLADFDVYEFRLKLILAGIGDISDGTLLKEQVVALSQTGEEIEQTQEHPAWKLLERIQEQRLRLMDAMGLTKKRQVMIATSLGKTREENVVDRTVKILQMLQNFRDRNSLSE